MKAHAHSPNLQVSGKKAASSSGLASATLSRRALLRTSRGMIQRFASCPCGGNCPRCRHQAATSGVMMSESSDRFEQEADRVADEIVRTLPVDGTALEATAATRLQFKRVDASGAAAHAMPPAVGDALSSSGRPIEPSVRAVTEARFGHDLGAVRIYEGPAAAAAARWVGALAFTLGHHIVFDEGQYRPSVGEGRRLLAHELTHVMQQSGAARPALQAQGRRYHEEETPTGGLSCTLTEMASHDFDPGRSCCDDHVMERLRSMLSASRAAMQLALRRIESGASIEGLLRLHFGPSGPSMRSTILANIRTTLSVAEAFPSRHTFLCRPLSDEWGCRGEELALADTDSDITVCLGGGTITFDWQTILHELFHVSGVAILPVYGSSTITPAQTAAGEFETYYRPGGAESEDPRWSRYPSSDPRRNADSYRQLVAAVAASNWSDSPPSGRFVPTLAVGVGVGVPDFSPTIIARVAFTPLGRGLHFITPGAIGFWSPTLGTVTSSDPNARQARGYVGGELGARVVTGVGPVAGVFDLATGAGAAFTRGGSIDPAAIVRGSAGVRFGGPSFGASINADLIRIFDFALNEQRTDGWILGLSGGLHWGGHSGAPR